MRVVDADVIIVGAGPAGLMLAAELRLAGVRPLVLERQAQLGETPNANGLGGQILQLLHYRGLLGRFTAAATDPSPTPIYPFGGVHLDLTQLADPPLKGMQLQHPSVDRLLDERAGELGADIRRGHEVADVSQDDATVTADVRGPDGPYRVTARYLVGCDGAYSRIRDMTGIPFPGTTYPEVNRLAELTVPDSVTLLANGDLDVPGLGRLEAGFTRTDRGVFAFGSLTPEVLMLNTIEDETTEYDDAPMTLTELQDSIRRVLGADLPLGEARRLSRYQHHARQADRYRDGRILLAGDAAHVLPATGAARNVGMLDSAADALREVFQELLLDEQPQRRLAALIAGTDIRYPLPGPDHHPLAGTFAPDLTLHTDQDTTTVAELMHTARPILLDLADSPELRESARDWGQRIDVHIAETDHRPADALLIRPDAHVAWAATIDEPTDTAALALREALSDWFGTPLKTTVPLIDQPS